jgi:hypothetical protein
MWSILTALAAWILHVSRILHGTGTPTHYRACGTMHARASRPREPMRPFGIPIPRDIRGPHQLCQRLARALADR